MGGADAAAAEEWPVLADRERAKALMKDPEPEAEPEEERAAATSSCAEPMLRRLDANSSATWRAYAAFSTCCRFGSCGRRLKSHFCI